VLKINNKRNSFKYLQVKFHSEDQRELKMINSYYTIDLWI